jgi:hypothetical protein
MAVQQAPGLWRTDLQRHDLSVDGHEVIRARVDLGPEAPLGNQQASAALRRQSGQLEALPSAAQAHHRGNQRCTR